MNVASDHFTTTSRTVFVPGRRTAVTSNSLARWESLPTPTSTPLTEAISTLSAAPTCSTTRRPAQSAGSSNVRWWTPVGFCAGGCGGRSGQGICTFV